MLTIQAKDLTQLSQAIFEAAGTPADIAAVVAEALVEANMLGHDSHGVLRVTRYVDMIRRGMIKPDARPTISRQTGAVAIVDGQFGFGQPIARFGTQLAGELAQAHGIGCVALNRTNHIGRLGEYAQMLAGMGMVSLLVTSNTGSSGSVAPFGGRDRIFGTNPLAWSLPVGPDRQPLVVDFATSSAAEGKLAVAVSKGVDVPAGLIVDKDGNPTTDPKQFYDGGALLPFGGHKGYGLLIMVQTMATGLGGLNDLPLPKGAFTNSTLITAWSVEAFIEPEKFGGFVEELIQRIKASRPAPGFADVLLPGEPEANMAAQRSAAGIPIPEATWEGLQALAQELGVKQ
jgi:LDH2 family malate/lactate/ureidoglycolate dehydrogenase